MPLPEAERTVRKVQTRETTQEQDREVKARELLKELQSFVNSFEKGLGEPFVMRAEKIPARERSLRAQTMIDSARKFVASGRKIFSQLDVAADGTQERKKIFDEKSGVAHLETERSS